MLGRYEVFCGLDKAGTASVYPTRWETLKLIGSVSIQRQFRQKGLGTELMKLVCSSADADGLDLKLFVAPMDNKPLDKEQLMEFYGRFGFFHTISNLMYRINPIHNRVYPDMVASRENSDEHRISGTVQQGTG